MATRILITCSGRLVEHGPSEGLPEKVPETSDGQIEAGNTVLISGAGPIGALTVLAANAAGAAQIFVVEPTRWTLFLTTFAY
jgi:NADPH:quinone reductase-like Zn-dependent oxidoreductase